MLSRVFDILLIGIGTFFLASNASIGLKVWHALKPQFYSSENFFVAMLPNVNYKAGQINDQINDQISDLELEVLRIVQRNPGIKVSGIHEELAKSGKAVTLDSIRNVIKRDIKGYIKLIGSRKTGGYHIKGKSEEGKR